MVALQPYGSARAARPLARSAAVALLLLFEVSQLDRVYVFEDAVAGLPSLAWHTFNDTMKVIVYSMLFASVALGLLVLARHRVLFAEWREQASHHTWGRWLAAQFALFTVLMLTVSMVQSHQSQTPWFATLLWLAGAAIMALLATLALAPLRFWRTFITQAGGSIVIAGLAGLATYGAFALSENSWSQLAGATLYGAYALLRLYEPGAMMDIATRQLGAGGFVVSIQAPCSGYEGIGLVTVMLSVYIWAFRRDLRFPHVLALAPIGAAAIWLLNIVRIALLISIGAHVSPSVALDGFHAQAGWVMFLAVTLSLIVLAHKAPIFRAANAPAVTRTRDPALRLTAALLTPFAVLMAARIGGAMLADQGRWLGVVLIAAPTAAIWCYRDAIRERLGKLTLEPIVVGLIVGALWIATQPAGMSALGWWLDAQGPAAAGTWLALRIFGFALIVPIAEELVFRGYLHSAFASRRFETAPTSFAWLPFLATSLLFGALHGRWLAGALAGAAFAFTLYRSKSLTGPIAAHIAANGLIAAFVLIAGRWELL